MALPRVVVFGEALTDIVQGNPGEWRGYPGGAPWNVARGLARLGVESAFGGAISQDGLGDEIAWQSETAGLDTRFLQRVAADPLAEAQALCRAIAGRNPDAIRAAKRLFAVAADGDAATILRAESDEQARLLGTANQREQVMANMEKRAARFRDG